VHVPAGRLRVLCALDGDSTELLKRAFARGAVSARGFDRITRVARTIADLAGNPAIGRAHVAEALRLRPTAAGAETAAALPV
jgi:magnesium chelatase family protein